MVADKTQGPKLLTFLIGRFTYIPHASVPTLKGV